MKRIGELKIKDGPTIKEFPDGQPEPFITYRRHREALVIKIHFTVGEDGPRQYYVLNGIVSTRTPTDDKEKILSELDSLPFVQELRDWLLKLEFPGVMANIAE
jgi:hypothetical protein